MKPSTAELGVARAGDAAPKSSLNCPVCDRSGIAAAAETCPNCGVDLTPIHRVRRLGELLTARIEPAGAQGQAERLGAPRPLLWALGLALTGLLILAALLIAAQQQIRRSDAELARAQSGLATGASASPEAVAQSAAPRKTAEPSRHNGSASLAAPADPSWQLTYWRDALREHDGVSVEKRGPQLLLRLAGPMFRGGSASLNPRGRSLLDSVASALDGSQLKLDVRIDGYTDPRPFTGRVGACDNWCLGLRRATSAARYLRQRQNNASCQLTVGSGGQFPESAAQGGSDDFARYRTVVLTLSKPVSRDQPQPLAD